MKKIVLLIYITLLVGSVFSQTKKINSRYAVDTEEDGIEAFYSREIHPLHGFLKKDGVFYGEFDSENIERLVQSDLNFYNLTEKSRIIPNFANTTQRSNRLTVHPCFQNSVNYVIPQNFSLGSYAGYFSLEEYHDEIDNMISLFPHLISEKIEIGVSIEGRPIHVLRISDNPGINQDKPQVLYTSIHHSQEPASLSVVIFFMYYLLENYGIDDELTYLINNTEMYFIPMINPDGYIHNETNNPNGGGLWRKNRRENSLFSYGVDLNRNYGYMFAYDNIGSQPIGSSPWHRGDSAFSEPESQALKYFLESKDFKIALNWHSYGNMIIYPYNYENIYTPDSLLYAKIGEVLSYQNNYRYGTVAETYGYQCNGDADDWGYGEQNSKNKIISLTGEVGTMDDGFWPEQNRIIPLCIDAVWMNLATAHFAHAYPEYRDLSSSLIEDYSGDFYYSIQNIGLNQDASFTISFNPLTSNLSFTDSPVEYNSLANMDIIIDSVAFVISGPYNQEIGFEIEISNGNYIFRDTIYKFFGQTETIFEDNCEDISNWDGSWEITDEYSYSGNYSVTDSPYSNYSNFSNKPLVLEQEIDLTESVYAVAQFMMRYYTEHNHDYVQIFASTDNGESWQQLCGRYSKYGSDDEDEGQPVYHGYLTDWTMEEILLNDFLGEIIKLKFHFISDQSNRYDGFYFDDFKVLSVNQNTVSKPELSNNIIEVFPNPVTDKLHIETDLNSFILFIYNSIGQIYINKHVKQPCLTIETNEWARGLYFYSIPDLNINGKILVK